MTTTLPPDHPERRVLADEVHARPPEALRTPRRVSYVAVFFDPARRGDEAAHLDELCRGAGVEVRLQAAVETLSIVAIVYCATGLVGTLAKDAKAAGFPLDSDVAVALALPFVAIAVVVAARKARRRVFGDDRA